MAAGLMGQERRSGVMRDHWKKGESATERYKARLAELVRPRMRILHAGCGWDRLDVSRPYRESCEVIGVDLDPRVAPMFHSEFHLGSLSSMPLDSSSFDMIFCEYVVEHLDDPPAALREMRRVLKPGGRILVLTPNLLSYKALAAALTPQRFHIWMGRIRYGRGHEADMYPTLYRCNTTGQFRRLAQEAGLEVIGTELVTNGPTWFEKFPGLFELFHVFHRAIARWKALSQLRCAMIVELRKPEGPARD
jgi:ubiquinone/menaquinone biosynthesis C-methylase UbiE